MPPIKTITKEQFAGECFCAAFLGAYTFWKKTGNLSQDDRRDALRVIAALARARLRQLNRRLTPQETEAYTDLDIS